MYIKSIDGNTCENINKMEIKYEYDKSETREPLGILYINGDVWYSAKKEITVKMYNRIIFRIVRNEPIVDLAEISSSIINEICREQ